MANKHYTTCYNNFPELFGKPNMQSVLFYLLCQRQAQMIKGKSPSFKISANFIAAKHSLNWRSVNTILDQLQQIGLIKIEDNICEFNSNMYESLMDAFCKLENSTDRKKFSDALLNGDFDTLSQMGYVLSEDFESNATENKGWLPEMQNPLQNYTTLCKNAEPSVDLQNLMQKYTTPLCKNAEGYVKMQNFARCIAAEITQNPDEPHDFNSILQILEQTEGLADITKGIFGEKSEKGYVKMQKWLCIFAEAVVYFYITENNNKENNKRNIQSEALVKEREEQNEKDDNEIEDDGLTREERSQKRKNIFEQFRTVEAVEMTQAVSTVRNTSEISSRKKSWSYPMLPVDEVDRIISDVSYAASSPLKLFINTVWWTLYDSLQNSEDFDEDEELSEDFDIEGYGYPIEDFQQNILETAYEEVQGNMEKGCVELEGGESIPVTFTEMFSVDLLDKIFKWEQTDLSHQESVYKISKSGIFDVTAERVERANQPQTREEKRTAVKDSLEYMTKLYLIHNTGHAYLRLLTPIEKLAANFIIAYMKPDKREGDPILRFSADPEKENVTSEGAINKWGWKQVALKVADAGYTTQEFLSCLLSNKGPTQYEQLIIQPCMFFAEGIRTLNKVHGDESIIDSITIESLRENE